MGEPVVSTSAPIPGIVSESMLGAWNENRQTITVFLIPTPQDEKSSNIKGKIALDTCTEIKKVCFTF